MKPRRQRQHERRRPPPRDEEAARDGAERLQRGGDERAEAERAERGGERALERARRRVGRDARREEVPGADGAGDGGVNDGADELGGPAVREQQEEHHRRLVEVGEAGRRRIAPELRRRNCAELAELRALRLGSQGRGVGDGAAPEDEPDELDEGGGEGEPEHPRVRARQRRHRREQVHRELDARPVQHEEEHAAGAGEQRDDAERVAGGAALGEEPDPIGQRQHRAAARARPDEHARA